MNVPARGTVPTEEPAPFHAARANWAPSALGASVTVCGLILALLTSLAVERLATGSIALGLAQLAVVVVVRWMLSEAADFWLSKAARRLRAEWRAVTLEFFFRPAPNSGPSPADIAGAIDAVVDAPRLAVVKASAQASILALPLIWLSGGWQSLVIVGALLALAVPAYQRAGSRAAALEAQHRDRRVRLANRQLELLAHAPELQALGAVEYARHEIGALSASEHEVALRAIRTSLGSSLVTEFLGGVSVGLVAMDVGFGLLNGRISLLRALIAVLVTSEFFVHVRRYGVEFHRRESVEAAARCLVAPPRDPGSPTDVLETCGLVTEAHPDELDLVITRGQRIALLGASGAGKTTLAHTLLGWRLPVRGHVRRTGGPVGYVSASTSLFEGSLGDNLRLGVAIVDERVLEQLRALGLNGPRFESLDGVVAADGEGYSSGERVRLLIARALLLSPTLLVLDDVGGLLDEAARAAVRSEIGRHEDIAVIEITVDRASLISATSSVRLA